MIASEGTHRNYFMNDIEARNRNPLLLCFSRNKLVSSFIASKMLVKKSTMYMCIYICRSDKQMDLVVNMILGVSQRLKIP